MDIWKHGKYFDTWSIVHLLTGFLLAEGARLLGFEFLWSLVLSFLVLLAWELCEMFMNIIEPSPNVAVDVLIGLGGFFVGAIVFFFLNTTADPSIFWVVLAITLALSAWGFIDFIKRGYR